MFMKQMKLPRDEMLHIRIEKTLKQKLEKAAKKEGVKVSQLVRYSIDSQIEKFGVSVLNGLAQESKKLDAELREKVGQVGRGIALVRREQEKYDQLKARWIELHGLNFALEAAIRFEETQKQKAACT